MSWKSIEMQVALPRVQDAGKLQEQMSKQNQQFQDSLAQSQLKQEEIRSKQVNNFEQVSDLKLKKDNDNDNPNQSAQHQHQSSSPQQSESTSEHPYLGNKIDFSG